MKKLVSVLLLCALLLPMGWAAAETAVDRDGPTVRLDVYSQLANYSGIQAHWSADLLLDKFNVKINIIPDSGSR